jgi:hypothetical protein
MARVRSTARVTREGEETEAAETAPISEVMRQSSLVMTEGGTDEGAPIAEAEQTIAEEGDTEEDEEDYSILIPSKPSHLYFEKSTVSEADVPMMMKLGYFGEAERKLVRFAGEETTPTPKDDEIVIFKSFFRAGLRFPLNEMIGEVLKFFEIYLHQLTPNAIVRLNIFIWALRSQGMDPDAEAFCRVHELHYQTKARADGLHENFGCYNFAYRKDTKAPVLSYRTNSPIGWKGEWFYIKANEKKREKLMMMVMCPITLNFGMTRPLCNIKPGSPCQLSVAEFRVVAEQISTRDLVQEYLANRTYPTSSDWSMSKLKGTKKKLELVRLPYRFKFEKEFKEPCQEWMKMIETMCNEVLGNYTKKEDQLMTAAFGSQPKPRLNRVMNALNFEYPDYERLNKGAEGAKRKRIVSVLSRQAARMVKEDEKALKKRKSSPEPKVTASKKRKAATLEPKVTEVEEEIPSTSPAVEVAKILKVMTESLPIKLLSPLGPELTKLFQKKEEPSATKKVDGLKKRRIGSIMQAIEKTPPTSLASKIAPAVSAEAATEANISVELAAAAEAANLESTLSGIDKLLLDMPTEEIVAAAEKVMAPVSDKGKQIADAASEEKDFDLRNLIGQELSEAEKKVIGTLSKSVGFPKLEADISSYQRQHIVGSLFYSNFKVKFL